MWQKYRTQKNGLHIFLRSIFLPLHVVSFGQRWRGPQESDIKKGGIVSDAPFVLSDSFPNKKRGWQFESERTIRC